MQPAENMGVGCKVMVWLHSAEVHSQLSCCSWGHQLQQLADQPKNLLQLAEAATASYWLLQLSQLKKPSINTTHVSESFPSLIEPVMSVQE